MENKQDTIILLLEEIRDYVKIRKETSEEWKEGFREIKEAILELAEVIDDAFNNEEED